MIDEQKLTDQQIARHVLILIKTYNNSWNNRLHFHTLGEMPWTDYIHPFLQSCCGYSNFALALSHFPKWVGYIISPCEIVAGVRLDDIEPDRKALSILLTQSVEEAPAEEEVER